MFRPLSPPRSALPLGPSKNLGATAPVDEFCGYEVGFSTLLGMLADEVREEEKLEDGKDDDQFDDDDCPKRLPQCHVAEAVIVQVEGTI